MKSIADSQDYVKRNTAKLSLTSGARVRKRKFAPPPPPPPVLLIGKLISLELTLAEYEIAPNAWTAARLDGAE